MSDQSRGSTLRGSVLLCVVVVTMVASTARAQKTDVLVLKNGDHITGEIKSLLQGTLEFSTDRMGTLEVEWPAVRRLTSSTVFEIELSNGRRLFGALSSDAKDDQLEILGEADALELESVVKLAPLKESFWSQINGSLDVGYNFAQSNVSSTYNANAKASYRTQHYLTLLGYSGYLNAQEGTDRTTRTNLTADLIRFLPNRWGGIVLSQFLQSSQLGIDFRSTVGGGVLRQLVETNRMTLMPVIGAVYSRSNFSGETEGRTELLALTGVRYDLYTFGRHKTDLTTSFSFLPSLTESGHVRLELESNFRIKLFANFYWSFNLFDSFDNDPPPGAAENDFGVSMSLGWTF